MRRRSPPCYRKKQLWLKRSRSVIPNETTDFTEPGRTQEGQAPHAACPCGNPALRTSEIRYRGSSRLHETDIIFHAAKLKITDVNPFMTELLGYSPDEFLGKELWQMGFFRDK